MVDEYLPQLHSRGLQARKDLEAFYRVIDELDVTNTHPEVRERQKELLERIKV